MKRRNKYYGIWGMDYVMNNGYKENIIGKLKDLERRGILKPAKKGKISDNIPIAIKGKPVSYIVIEGREDRT